MCNYLPVLPYGLVGIAPAGGSVENRRGQTFITDGRFFFRGDARHEADDLRPMVESAHREAAALLPVRVSGDAHWSVARLDPTRVRVTLIDPDYLDPAEREAEILLQHLDGVGATDILRREALLIEKGRIRVRIPAGTLRIVDIEHR